MSTYYLALKSFRCSCIKAAKKDSKHPNRVHISLCTNLSQVDDITLPASILASKTELVDKSSEKTSFALLRFPRDIRMLIYDSMPYQYFDLQVVEAERQDNRLYYLSQVCKQIREELREWQSKKPALCPSPMFGLFDVTTTFLLLTVDQDFLQSSDKQRKWEEFCLTKRHMEMVRHIRIDIQHGEQPERIDIGPGNRRAWSYDRYDYMTFLRPFQNVETFYVKVSWISTWWLRFSLLDPVADALELLFPTDNPRVSFKMPKHFGIIDTRVNEHGMVEEQMRQYQPERIDIMRLYSGAEYKISVPCFGPEDLGYTEQLQVTYKLPDSEKWHDI